MEDEGTLVASIADCLLEVRVVDGVIVGGKYGVVVTQLATGDLYASDNHYTPFLCLLDSGFVANVKIDK